MSWSLSQESMLRWLHLWSSRLYNKGLASNGDARRRKKGKLRRVKPPWKLT